MEILTIYLDIFKIRILIQIKLCGNASMQMDLSKNNRFSTQETINYIPYTEKRKKVSVCEKPESSGSLPSSMLPIMSWKLKIITYRAEAGLALLHHLSWNCFLSRSWPPEIILSQKASSQMICASMIRL